METGNYILRIRNRPLTKIFNLSKNIVHRAVCSQFPILNRYQRFYKAFALMMIDHHQFSWFHFRLEHIPTRCPSVQVAGDYFSSNKGERNRKFSLLS